MIDDDYIEDEEPLEQQPLPSTGEDTGEWLERRQGFRPHGYEW